MWESPEKIASVSPLQKGHPPPNMRGNRQFEERFRLSVLQASVCVLLTERYRLKLEKIAAAPQAREPRTLLRAASCLSSRSDEWRALTATFLAFFLENFSICTITFDIVLKI